MGTTGEIGLSRRAFLGGIGAGAGLVLAGGTSGLPRWLGGRAYADLDNASCLARLDASLSPRQRALTVHPWDHPSRQITNTIAIFKGPHIGTLFDADQVALVRRLYETMLSEQGLSWFENTVTLEGKLEGCVLAIFGDQGPGELASAAARGRAQTMITGAHLMLRKGGAAASGYVFGGPIAYGQQIGNGEFRVRGNAFAVHGDALNRFYESLGPNERVASIVPSPPHELMIQPQGAEGEFEGIAVGTVSPAARERAIELLETVFAAYEPEARSDAVAAIEENGGIDSLHVAVYAGHGHYEDGGHYGDLSAAARELPYWQVWRIEGPGCVVHFKGDPHVHAYIDIVRDPARQNIGEVLTRTAAPLRPAAVRRMLTAALRHETEATLAYYPSEVPARVRAGDVTAGLVHTLDPFDERIVVARIHGAAMSADVRAQAEAQGVVVESGREYRVATVSYWAGREDVFGQPDRVDSWDRPMREALAAYLRGRDLGVFHVPAG